MRVMDQYRANITTAGLHAGHIYTDDGTDPRIPLLLAAGYVTKLVDDAPPTEPVDPDPDAVPPAEPVDPPADAPAPKHRVRHGVPEVPE